MRQQSRPETGPRIAKRPAILRVITRLNVGGPARQAILLSNGLKRHGFDSELVSGSEDQNEGHVPPLGIPHTKVPTLKRPVDPLSDLRALRSLKDVIGRGRPDIVHTHMAKAGVLGRTAASRAHVPVVVHTFHGHILEGYFSRAASRTFMAIERRLARRSHALVAVSGAVRDQLLAYRIGVPEQWHVIPVGLNLGPYLENAMSRVESRQLLDLPRESLLVGFVGRLVAVKDPDTFLQAATRVATERGDVTFIVAGDGELRAQMESRAKQLLGERIRFVGWVSNLAALYSALDLVVLTSRHEGTPTALVEAGASGRPVVATRVGGVPDVVREGASGLLVPPGDPVAAAGSMLSLLADTERRRAMGDAARAWVRDRFSLERLTGDLASLYTHLLGRKGINVRPTLDEGS
jgi:glycosyltransferase involved in cell wall biosynthesis